MDGDFFKILGDVVEAFGLGENVTERATQGIAAYLGGRSTETSTDDGAEAPYVYERWLTRPRDPGINDR